MIIYFLYRVKLAKHKTSGEVCALKIMKNPGSMESSMMKLVMNEIEVMKELDHPNIVKLLDSSYDAEYKRPNGSKLKVFYLALELVSGGELFDFIAETGRFTEDVARYYFHQIIAALEYLHTNGYSHRDIKPENMMLDSEFNLKLADFGFSSNQALNETKRGTDGYMAPEIYKGITYSGQSVDLFATAIILFIMVAQHPPFGAASSKDPHYKLISTNKVDTFWKVHCKRKPGGDEYFTESFKSLITAMLSYNPHERPSLAEIKSHEWFNGPVPTYEEIRNEFEQRKYELSKRNNQSDQPIPQDVVPPSVFQANTVYKSVGDDNEEGKLPELKRRAAEYIPEFKRYTEFYSTSSVEDLFNVSALYAKNNATEFTFDDEEFSTTMKLKSGDSKITVVVNILEAGEGKSCIEVVKESGDKFAFHDAYHEIKKFYGGHANLSEMTA